MARTWQTSKLLNAFWRRFEPPPDLSISEWSDEYRFLSAESAAERGKFYISRTPYMREVVDTVCDPDVEETWVKKSAQIAYSENGNNIIGYFIHQDPCPMMMMQPTLDMSQAYSKDRISPMIRDTPVLAGLIDDRSRTSGNTILHKKFPGGQLTMCGANSPASLASRPIRGAFVDEPDRYPSSAGEEGDPIKLLQARQITFWNRWFFAGGTPTVKGFSRIEVGFNRGDQRYYHIPCHHCGDHIALHPSMQMRDPEDEHYSQFQCSSCNKWLEETYKLDMLKDEPLGGSAHWVASQPFKGVASFHIWAAYSPWMSWLQIADKYNETKDDPQLHKTFVNTIEGETYEEAGEAPEIDDLMNKRIEYEPSGIPEGVLVATAGVDSQGDRLEIEVIGWGVGEESWSLDYRTFMGDPLQQQVWDDLDTYLKTTTFTRRDGKQLKIKACLIDSGGKGSQADGHVSDRVYKFARGKVFRNIFACKGSSSYGKPIIASANKLKKPPIRLITIGTDTAKDLIYSRLELVGEGEGRCHFPLTYERKYFEMLTAEEKFMEWKNGSPVMKWRLGESADGKKKKRNEALDTRVYALAALRLLPINLKAMAKRQKSSTKQYTLKKKQEKVEQLSDSKEEKPLKKPPEKSKPKAKKPARRRPRRGGGGGSWSCGAV